MKSKDPKKYTEDQVLSVLSHGGIVTNEMIESLGIPRLKAMLKKFIPDSIFVQAKKMDVNLYREFLRVILCKENLAEMRENLVATSAGIVGSVLANQHFKKLGYKVENEVPIFDDTGKKVTATDLKLTNKAGEEVYVELKTSRGVISKSEDYPQPEHPDDPSKPIIPGVTVFPRENYDVRKVTLNRIAVSTGEKAVEQIIKNRHYIDNIHDGKKRSVRLCVFNGTTISKDIREAILQHAEIETLPIDVNKIFDYCTALVVGVINEGRNMLYPPKGVTPRDVYKIVKESEREIEIE